MNSDVCMESASSNYARAPTTGILETFGPCGNFEVSVVRKKASLGRYPDLAVQRRTRTVNPRYSLTDPRCSYPPLSQVDCKTGFDTAPCDAASLSGTADYLIDWTVGTGAKMDTDWCPMTLNTAEDECPSERFRTCESSVS